MGDRLTLETAGERDVWLDEFAAKTGENWQPGPSSYAAWDAVRAYRERLPEVESDAGDDDDWPSLGEQRLAVAIRAAMHDFEDEYSHGALVEAWANMGRNSRTFAADQIARRVFASTTGERLPASDDIPEAYDFNMLHLRFEGAGGKPICTVDEDLLGKAADWIVRRRRPADRLRGPTEGASDAAPFEHRDDDLLRGLAVGYPFQSDDDRSIPDALNRIAGTIAELRERPPTGGASPEPTRAVIEVMRTLERWVKVDAHEAEIHDSSSRRMFCDGAATRVKLAVEELRQALNLPCEWQGIDCDGAAEYMAANAAEMSSPEPSTPDAPGWWWLARRQDLPTDLDRQPLWVFESAGELWCRPSGRITVRVIDSDLEWLGRVPGPSGAPASDADVAKGSEQPGVDVGMRSMDGLRSSTAKGGEDPQAV